MDNKIVWINVDGMRKDLIYQMIDAGELPNFTELFRDGLRVERACSIFPSVTLACQSSLFTGCWPNRHYLLGNGWLDRYQKPPVYRDYTTMHEALRVYGFKLFGWPTILLPPRKDEPLANAEINKEIPTIYQTMEKAGMDSCVVYNQVSRGATAWVRPSRLDMINFALCHEEKTDFDRFERATMKRAVNYARKCKVFPRLFMVYFSGLDGYIHRYGPQTTEMYCKKYLDPMLGSVIDAIRRRKDTKNLQFILTADHGQAYLKRDEQYMILDTNFEKMLVALNRKPYFTDSKTPIGEADVIFRNEGGSMHVYVRNTAGGGWDEPPSMDGLARFAEEIFKLSQSPFEHILPGWLSLVLLKKPEDNRYFVWKDGSILTKEEFFEGKDDYYPDAIKRLEGYESPRSADVVLMSNYEDGFYFSDVLHGGQHGSLSWHDSIVPLIAAGDGIKKGSVERGSIMDATPTAAAMMGLDTPDADGSPLPFAG